MAQNLASLLVTVVLTARTSGLATSNHGAVAAALEGPDPHTRSCQMCQKACPINCFVGHCDYDSNWAHSVRRIEETNRCYSCDPAVSVGINSERDFMKCETDDHSAYLVQGFKDGPQGPAEKGDAGLAAQRASKQAEIAFTSATRASDLADKAYRELTSDGDKAFGEEEEEMNRQAATQTRAEEALRKAEGAHLVWKTATVKYNSELLKLRRQQIVTDLTAKRLEAAEMISENARHMYLKEKAEAQHAYEADMLNGGNAANKITAQAAAEELAAAATSAHRRLLIAAKEAKDATQKIRIAARMTPCQKVFLQVAQTPGAPPLVGCASLEEKQGEDTNLADGKVVPLTPPQLPQASAPPSAMTPANADGIDDVDDDEAGVQADGQLKVPSLEQQMTASLAEKLESNPAAVEDPSLFAVPNVPFQAEAVPVDGMEQPTNFDMSTISALQTGHHRSNLRQGNSQP